jgi:hypothetical protein
VKRKKAEDGNDRRVSAHLDGGGAVSRNTITGADTDKNAVRVARANDHHGTQNVAGVCGY